MARKLTLAEKGQVNANRERFNPSQKKSSYTKQTQAKLSQANIKNS